MHRRRRSPLTWVERGILLPLVSCAVLNCVIASLAVRNGRLPRCRHFRSCLKSPLKYHSSQDLYIPHGLHSRTVLSNLACVCEPFIRPPTSFTVARGTPAETLHVAGYRPVPSIYYRERFYAAGIASCPAIPGCGVQTLGAARDTALQMANSPTQRLAG